MSVRPLRDPNHVRRDLRARLNSLYGQESAEKALTALLAVAEQYRMGQGTSYALSEKDALLIAYGDHVRAPGEAPLVTLRQTLKRLNTPINGLHVLPFYPYSSDDGFSVIDYEQVDPELGTWEDIQQLAADYRLMFDAVFNHISAQSEWFAAFRRGEAPYDGFFITVDPSVDRSQVTRPRTLPLLSPVETAMGLQHVWTTFSDDQVDLNFSNPAVLVEVARILLKYVQMGAALIRLDAIAFLWKQEGTSCIHLPQTHTVIQILRDILDLAAPHVLFVTETNVPHQENISYFGDGANEAQLVYQFPLPPLVAHSLLTGSARRLLDWAETIEPVSPFTTFFNFTASHDGVGVRPVTGIFDDDELANLVQAALDHGGQVSYKLNSDGSRSPYELNITYFDLINPPELTKSSPDTAVQRFLVSQAIALAMIGVPGIYLPSLFGGRNDDEGVARTGRARSINRRKYDEAWLMRELSDSKSLSARVLEAYRRLLAVRVAEPAFHPHGHQRVHRLDDRVVALEHQSLAGEHRVLALHNVGDEAVTLQIPSAECGHWEDGLDGGHPFDADADGLLHVPLGPYQIAWLKARN